MTRARLRAITRDGTVMMMAGTILAGLATYAWQMTGTRTLGSVAFAPVATVWTTQFLIVTVLLAPVEQFAIRAIASGPSGRAQLARSMRALALLAAGSTALLILGTFALRGPLFNDHGAYALICGAIVLGFGQLALIRGILAGKRDFAGYGYVTGLDSVVRMCIGIPLLLGGGSALAFAWTIPASTLVALLWLGHRPRRHEATGLEEPPPTSLEAFIATTAGGNAAAQVVLAGGPLVLALLGAPKAAITTLFVTQTAFRAAFVIATPGWSRALPALTRLANRQDYARLVRFARLLFAGSLAAATVAGAFSALAAPPLIGAVFGDGVRPSAFLAGLAATGTVLAMGNLGLMQILIAVVRTHRITAAWWLALVVAATWLFAVPGSELDRVTLAFVVGELAAAVGLTLSVATELAVGARYGWIPRRSGAKPY